MTTHFHTQDLLWWTPLRRPLVKGEWLDVVRTGIALQKLTARDLLVASVWTRRNWFGNFIFEMSLTDRELRAVLRAVGNWPSKWTGSKFQYCPRTLSEGLALAECHDAPIDPFMILVKASGPLDTVAQLKHLFTIATPSWGTLQEIRDRGSSVEFQLNQVTNVDLFKYKLRLLRRWVGVRCSFVVSGPADLLVLNKVLKYVDRRGRQTIRLKRPADYSLMIRKRRLFNAYFTVPMDADTNIEGLIFKWTHFQCVPWNTLYRRMSKYMEECIEADGLTRDWDKSNKYTVMCLALSLRKFDVYLRWRMELSCRWPSKWPLGASCDGNLLEDLIRGDWVYEFAVTVVNIVPFGCLVDYFRKHGTHIQSVDATCISRPPQSYASYHTQFMWSAVCAARPDFVINGTVVGCEYLAFWTEPSAVCKRRDQSQSVATTYGPRDTDFVNRMNNGTRCIHYRLRREAIRRLDPELRTLEHIRPFKHFGWNDWLQWPQLCDTSEDNEMNMVDNLTMTNDIVNFVKVGMYNKAYVRAMMDADLVRRAYPFRLNAMHGLWEHIVPILTLDQVRQCLEDGPVTHEMIWEFAKLREYKTAAD